MRLAPLLAAVALTLAACGDEGEGESNDDAATATSIEGSIPEVSLEPATTPAGSVPAVEIPAELPTELVVTELQEGSGQEAATGDSVLVHYVGVRSEDGQQFDTNFGRDPLRVKLGEGGVIKGWEEGLVGAQQGGRMQLDIPADLAYGDQPQGELIKPGDALTFVIDVLAVVPATDAADAPTDISIPTSEGATEVTFEDLVEGDGQAALEGKTGVMHLIAARADNSTILQSTWETEEVAIPIAENAMLEGMFEGITGMKPGGRRLITIPFEKAWGPDGRPDMGLPAKTDLVLIVDMLAVY